MFSDATGASDEIKSLTTELILSCTFSSDFYLVLRGVFPGPFGRSMVSVATVWQHDIAVGGEAMFFSLISPELCSLWSCGQFYEYLLGTAMFSEKNISAKARESLGAVRVCFFSVEKAASIV